MRQIIAAVITVALTGCADPPVPAAHESAARRTDTSTAGSAAQDTRAGDGRADPAAAGGVVLFVGTSLTAGYGVGADRAYPAVLQQKIDSAGLPFRVSNAGISGETSAGGLSRIDWVLQAPVDVLVLELGANDALRGLDPAQLRENLDAILRRTRAAHPDAEILLLGMEAPPNLGATYTRRFRNVYRELAEQHDAALVPFLLEGVAAVPALNQADGIHPTAEGQARMAETVWQALGPLLAARAARAQRESSESP